MKINWEKVVAWAVVGIIAIILIPIPLGIIGGLLGVEWMVTPLAYEIMILWPVLAGGK
jgi:hypothetical protein